MVAGLPKVTRLISDNMSYNVLPVLQKSDFFFGLKTDPHKIYIVIEQHNSI